MSEYNNLKALIDNNIYENNNQEITGDILNGVLKAMVNVLGDGYLYKGIATTATNPNTPDAKVFYIAKGKGIYTHFGNIVVSEDDVVILYWDEEWHKASSGIASQNNITDLNTKVGNLTSLTTTHMDNLVNAINDVDAMAKKNMQDIRVINGQVSTISGNITTIEGRVSAHDGVLSTLNGEISTIKGNVNTLNGQVSTINGQISNINGQISGIGGELTRLNGVVSFIEQHIGNLSDLSTEAKDNLVNAINEVFAYAYEPDGHVYGVRHYYNNASTVLTRFQTSTSHDLHQLLPVQSLMRRCVLKDDGEVAYYLDHDNSELKEDGTPAILDGTDGMVMVEIPMHYRKHTLVENAETPSLSYYETAISLLPFSGAFRVNKCYISAYEASVDRTTNTLASVQNTTDRYRGGNNNATWDNTYRDLRGLPATVISLTNFRAYARKRGAYWNCQEWDIYNTLYWLYTIEYANLNCQLAYNEVRDGSGYHQGGLGSGVSYFSNWSAYNGNYPIIPCGFTNSLGNNTGVKAFVLNEEQAVAYGAAHTEYVPSYRGVENPFGHLWKWTDGFLAIGNGTTQMYSLCRDRAQYASAKNANYEDIGLSVGASGYGKTIVRNDKGDLLVNGVGGSSTTYFSDYHYEAFNNGSTYGVFCGGTASAGATAGFAFLYSTNAPSETAAFIGSRLCWSSHERIYENE